MLLREFNHIVIYSFFEHPHVCTMLWFSNLFIVNGLPAENKNEQTEFTV